MDSTKTTEEKTKRPRGRPRKVIPPADPADAAIAADDAPKKPKAKRVNKPGKTFGPDPMAIDWEWVNQMCIIDATAEEICSCYRNPNTGKMGISTDTLSRACERELGVKLADYLEEKRKIGRASLRRRQHQAAMEGNTALLIFLGKNRLGQTDKQEIAHDNAASGKLIVNLTTDKPG